MEIVQENSWQKSIAVEKLVLSAQNFQSSQMANIFSCLQYDRHMDFNWLPWKFRADRV